MVLNTIKENKMTFFFSFVNVCSVAKLCLNLSNPMGCNTPVSPVLHYLSWILCKFMSIELVMLSKHFILVSRFSSGPTSFPASRSFLMSLLFASGGKVSELQLHISSNEYSGLISFWTDWFVLLAAQGSLKSLLQLYQKHQFFHAQPSLWSNSHVHSLLLEKP